MIPPTQRLTSVAPYVFCVLDQKVQALRHEGVKVYDLSKSDPDLAPPRSVTDALKAAVDSEHSHLYPPFRGTSALREAVSDRYRRRYGVAVDPEREVFILSGSKEGIAHLAMAWLDPGDVALVPDPAYPTYRAATLLAGANPVSLPLDRARGFLPDLEAVPAQVWRRTRLLYLNYPNNPTGAVAGEAFLREVVALAHRHQVTVLFDNAYAETGLHGYRAPSFLATPGARAVGLEVWTFSKPFSMQGLRLGVLVGAPAFIDRFATVETNLMAGVYTPLQAAGVVALGPAGEAHAAALNQRYEARQARVLAGLARMGYTLAAPAATVYLWVPTVEGMGAQAMADSLLYQAHVAVSPGTGFGPGGEGHVRISLTAPDADIDRAMAAWAHWMEHAGHRVRREAPVGV